FFDEHALVLASILTASALFVLGVQKVHFTNKHWFTSGLEMLLVGGVAAVVAYGIGVLLSGLA
ncbi:MAG: VIT1/CCC1 transporter family protein, partial [Rhodothermales bacterium]